MTKKLLFVFLVPAAALLAVAGALPVAFATEPGIIQPGIAQSSMPQIVSIPFVSQNENNVSKTTTTSAAHAVPGEAVVTFKKPILDLGSTDGKQKAETVANAEDAVIKDTAGSANSAIVASKNNESAGQLVNRLKKDKAVADAQPNFLYEMQDIPTNDPLKGMLWGLDNTGQAVQGVSGSAGADIHAPSGWNIFEGPGIVPVAVIDTGTWYTHEDLNSQMWSSAACKDDTGAAMAASACSKGYDFEANTSDPFPDAGQFHGTHVSGIIAAAKNNGVGIMGVAPNAKIASLKVDLSTAQIARAISFAEQNGIKIINASWGASAFSCDGVNDPVLYNAIKNYTGLFVTAAGNQSSTHNGSGYFMVPADYGHDTACWSALPNIVSVAATTSSDALAGFSDRGPWVDVAAPGVNILSTYIGTNNQYAYLSGTSMAAPFVSGEAALIWGYDPALSVAQVKQIIIDTGDAVPALAGTIASSKRINIANALQLFNPVMGFNADNILPATQIVQALDGSGLVTVNFKIKDGEGGLPVTLSNFKYSTDNGTTWQALADGDASKLLSAHWNDSPQYLTAADFSGSGYSFTLDSKNKTSPFAGANSDNIRFEFQSNDGAKTSAPVVTDAFALHNALLAAPVITAPAAATLEKTDSYTITGTAPAGTLVQVYAQSKVVESAQLAPDKTDFSIVVPLQKDSANNFTLTASDAFGNTSVAAVVPVINQDSGAAHTSLASIAGISAAPFVVSTATPEIIFNADKAVACRWDAVNNVYSKMPAANEITVITASGKTTGDITLPDQGADGSKNIYIACVDSNGIEQATDQTLHAAFTLDAKGLAATLVGTPSDPDTSAIPYLNVSVSGKNITAYKYKLDSADYSAETVLSVPIVTGILTNGPHTLTVKAKDASGVWQPDSGATIFSWTVKDTTAPEIQGLSNDSGSVPSKTWNWSSPDPSAKFRFAVDQNATWTPTGDFTAVATATQGSGSGTYYLHVQAQDSSGNSSDVVTVSVTLAQPAVSNGGGGGGGGGGGSGGGGGIFIPVVPAPSPAPAPITGGGGSSGGSGPGSGGGSGGSGSGLVISVPTNPLLPQAGQVLGANTAVDPNGTLVSMNGGISLIQNAQLRGFQTPIELFSYNYNFSNVVSSNAADQNLSTGGFMPALPGTLASDPSSKSIYIIGSNGIKQPFTSLKIFRALGFRTGDIKKFSLVNYPDGNPVINSKDAHPDGTVVIQGKTIWWVYGGMRHVFPSWDVFTSFGFGKKTPVAANRNDMILPEGSQVPTRDQFVTGQM